MANADNPFVIRRTIVQSLCAVICLVALLIAINVYFSAPARAFFNADDSVALVKEYASAHGLPKAAVGEALKQCDDITCTHALYATLAHPNERYIMFDIIQTRHASLVCHACDAFFSVVMRRQHDDGLTSLLHVDYFIDHIGSWGQLPADISLVDIGAVYPSIAMEFGYTAQGVTTEAVAIYADIADDDIISYQHVCCNVYTGFGSADASVQWASTMSFVNSGSSLKDIIFVMNGNHENGQFTQKIDYHFDGTMYKAQGDVASRFLLH